MHFTLCISCYTFHSINVTHFISLWVFHCTIFFYTFYSMHLPLSILLSFNFILCIWLHEFDSMYFTLNYNNDFTPCISLHLLHSVYFRLCISLHEIHSVCFMLCIFFIHFIIWILLYAFYTKNLTLWFSFLLKHFAWCIWLDAFHSMYFTIYISLYYFFPMNFAFDSMHFILCISF